jgi:hypothetical protein
MQIIPRIPTYVMLLLLAVFFLVEVSYITANDIGHVASPMGKGSYRLSESQFDEEESDSDFDEALDAGDYNMC